MPRIAVLALLIASALAQTAQPPIRVSPDEAARHLIKGDPPQYPPAAEAGRIQGIVLFEIGIDESGGATVRSLITGHPMLVSAAARAVNGWKYQPFDSDGRPVPVITFVAVGFGDLAKDGGAVGRADVLYLEACRAALDTASAALAKGDYAEAEKQLTKAKQLDPPHDPHVPNVGESWQWTTTMGRLRMGQQRFDEAEEFLKKAIAQSQNKALDKDAPQLAASFGNLGLLYLQEKKSGPARENIVRSVAIYQKNFRKAGSGNPTGREAYGQAIAYQTLALINLARQEKNAGDIDTECRTIEEFQEFLRPPDRSSLVSSCEQSASAPAKP